MGSIFDETGERNNMKNAIITGATSGIGYETALHLAKLGWRIGITWRNEERGKKTVEKLIAESGNNDIHGFSCDLTSFSSIKNCSEEIVKAFPVIDVLINNAGTWETSYTITSEGIETMFMVNFLAPVYLSRKLVTSLSASSGARVINVSSAAHMMGKVNMEDPESHKKFRHIRAYGNSKLYLLLASRWLAAEWADAGIRVNALHPGVVNTRLFDKFPGFMKGMTRLFTITPKKGAQTSIYLATSDEGGKLSGKYFARSRQKNSSAEGMSQANIELAALLCDRYLNSRL